MIYWTILATRAHFACSNCSNQRLRACLNMPGVLALDVCGNARAFCVRELFKSSVHESPASRLATCDSIERPRRRARILRAKMIQIDARVFASICYMCLDLTTA